MIENDIVSRYYYRKGAIKQQLRDDKDLKAALEILSDMQRYKKILKP